MTCCPCTYYHALSSIISFIYIYHQVNENSQFYWQNKTQLFTVEAKNKEEKWYFLDIPKLKEKKIAQKITLIQTESFLESNTYLA